MFYVVWVPFFSINLGEVKFGFLPSFLCLLATGAQSSQTRPALLWLQRISGSLRLQKHIKCTTKTEHSHTVIEKWWETLTTSASPPHCFHLRPRAAQVRNARSGTSRCIQTSAAEKLTGKKVCMILSSQCTQCRDEIPACEASGCTVYRWLKALS